MRNLKNVEDITEDVTWLNFKGYDIRLEMSDYDNGNLTICVTPEGSDDYTHKFTVVEEDEQQNRGHQTGHTRFKR